MRRTGASIVAAARRFRDLKLFPESRELFHNTIETDKSIITPSFTNLVLLGAVETEKHSEVVGVVNTMLEKNLEFTPKMATVVVASYLRVNSPEFITLADTFLDKARLGSPLAATHITSIMTGFAQAGACQLALKYRDMLIDSGNTPSMTSNNTIMRSLAQANLKHEAMQLFSEMENVNSQSCTNLMAAVGNDAKLVDKVMDMTGDPLDADMLNGQISMLLRIDRIIEAIELYERIGFRNGYTYQLVLKACKPKNMKQLASQVISEIVETKAPVDVGLVRLIIGVLEKHDALSSAVGWFQHLTALPNKKGLGYYKIAHRIIKACASEGKHEDVILTYESTEAPENLISECIETVVSSYKAARRADEAPKISN